MLEVAEKEQGQGEMQSDGKDEVSISYYGEHCSCSKTAKCKSSKCLCFLRDEKCSPECHNGKNNCTNILHSKVNISLKYILKWTWTEFIYFIHKLENLLFMNK